MTTALVTGGAGFIGSNFIRLLRAERPRWRVVNLDLLTYAGNLSNLEGVEQEFVRGDVAEPSDVHRAFDAAGEGALVVHFAAESHVDRSIRSSLPFLRTNVLGTQVLLDVARERRARRLLHVSTDEVYGSLPEGVFADETHCLHPSNPYAASKAASDHLVLAAVNTHGIDAVVTRCSNNYGPYQFPEKVVPLMIANAREDRALPLYGDGLHQRDWIHVDDHGEALLTVLERGVKGEIYNVAGGNHKTNLALARFLLAALGKSKALIEHVKDRPGHDRRYAPDGSKILRDLGWKPKRRFEEGMAEVVRWYDRNGVWLDSVRSGAYRSYYAEQYGGEA